jgi:hypothetical protein
VKHPGKNRKAAIRAESDAPAVAFFYSSSLAGTRLAGRYKPLLQNDYFYHPAGDPTPAVDGGFYSLIGRAGASAEFITTTT